MNAAYCPLCEHCQRRKLQEEKLEIARLQREETEANEKLEKEKQQERLQRLKIFQQGVIHGDDYSHYTIDEIRNITNYDFLERMSDNISDKIFRGAQPVDEVDELEYNTLYERSAVISEQMNRVLINELE